MHNNNNTTNNNGHNVHCLHLVDPSLPLTVDILMDDSKQKTSLTGVRYYTTVLSSFVQQFSCWILKFQHQTHINYNRNHISTGLTSQIQQTAQKLWFNRIGRVATPDLGLEALTGISICTCSYTGHIHNLLHAKQLRQHWCLLCPLFHVEGVKYFLQTVIFSTLYLIKIKID